MQLKDDVSSIYRTRSNVPCGRSASEVNRIVKTFDEVAALLLPNADTPISPEMVGNAVQQLIVENGQLRDETTKASTKSEENTDGNGDKRDAIYPALADEPEATSSEGSRRFYGRWREHWKVGARVELKKCDSDTISATAWLPGRITRAIDTLRDDPVDRYDVKLDNEDEVLEVSAADLRTLQETGPGAKKKDEPSEEGKAFGTILMFLLGVAFVKNYILGV